jgi:hypothetical protein
MIETALSVNGQDCTNGAGNSPEEYEAMAATLLRVAQAIREEDNGVIQCLSKDGRVLISAIIDNRKPIHNGTELEFPTIEQFRSLDEQPDLSISLRDLSRSIIDHYRKINIKDQY